MKLRLPIGIVLCASLATACLPAFDRSSPSAAGGGATGDDAQILAAVANGAYRKTSAFRPVSSAAYVSAISTSQIDVWVTASDYASYARIAPDKSGSGATLAPGAIVVREVLDASGAVSKLTLMAKGPAGYNPMVGDFWFGVTTPDGTPIVSNGVPQTGKVQECFGCHMPRAADGYLFGVPMADRAPPGGDGGVAGGAPDGGVAGAPDGGEGDTDGGSGSGDGGCVRHGRNGGC